LVRDAVAAAGGGALRRRVRVEYRCSEEARRRDDAAMSSRLRRRLIEEDGVLVADGAAEHAAVRLLDLKGHGRTFDADERAHFICDDGAGCLGHGASVRAGPESHVRVRVYGETNVAPASAMGNGCRAVRGTRVLACGRGGRRLPA